MAEVFAPFPIQRTMCNLTFYVIEGRNFVRKKSSLTRRRVLYSPHFKNTRHFAGLMGKASKIGSHVYNALPAYWRQGWMFRSFTGEAYTMLKSGKTSAEIQQALLQRYVEPVISKQIKPYAIVTLPTPPKRGYQKLNSEYWKNKTIKSARRKARKQQTLYYAGLMALASKIGSKLYGQLPCRNKSRGHYQYLTGLVLKLLKQDINEHDIFTELLPTLGSTDRPGAPDAPCKRNATEKKAVHVISHQKGQYFFIPSLHKRFPRPVMAWPEARFCTARTVYFFPGSADDMLL
jgi:hypothetical protein